MFRVSGLSFRVSHLNFKIQGFRFRVSGVDHDEARGEGVEDLFWKLTDLRIELRVRFDFFTYTQKGRRTRFVTALCGANLVTLHPGIRPRRNPRTPPYGCIRNEHTFKKVGPALRSLQW